jgi:hypothetical protein
MAWLLRRQATFTSRCNAIGAHDLVPEWVSHRYAGRSVAKVEVPLIADEIATVPKTVPYPSKGLTLFAR